MVRVVRAAATVAEPASNRIVRRSQQVLAPLLASTALGLLSGCTAHAPRVSGNDAPHRLDPSLSCDSAGKPVARGLCSLDASGTARGGFGENFGALVLASAAAGLLLFSTGG